MIKILSLSSLKFCKICLLGVTNVDKRNTVGKGRGEAETWRQSERDGNVKAEDGGDTLWRVGERG